MTPTSESRSRTEERSVGELVDVATIQMSRLLRDEMRLARLELHEKTGAAAKGAGLAGVGGLLLFYGGAAVLAAVVLAVALMMPVWAAALSVGALLIVLGAALTTAGKKQVRAQTPPIPEEAIANTRTDIDTIRRQR